MGLAAFSFLESKYLVNNLQLQIQEYVQIIQDKGAKMSADPYLMWQAEAKRYDK